MMKYFNDDIAFVTSRRNVIDPAGNILYVAGLDDINQQNLVATSDVPTYLEIIRKRKNSKCVFINESLSAFRRHFDQNGHNINVVINTFFDWAKLIYISYTNKIFLTDDQLLKNSCQSWQTMTSKVLKNFSDVENLEQSNFYKIDLLVQMIDSLENQDYARFLKLIEVII